MGMMDPMQLFLAHENANRIMTSVRELGEFQAEQEKAKYGRSKKSKKSKKSKSYRKAEHTQQLCDYISRNEEEQRSSSPTSCFSSYEELKKCEEKIAKHYSNF